MKRHSAKEIIPGRVYQRGQILTWKRADKERMLERYNIGIIVNFWHKIDPDLAEMPILYIHMPVYSKEMLEEKTLIVVEMIVDMLGEYPNVAVLVLCEAGVTRSVYFTILVVSDLLDISLLEAHRLVKKHVPKMRLKDFMLDYIDLGV